MAEVRDAAAAALADKDKVLGVGGGRDKLPKC